MEKALLAVQNVKELQAGDKRCLENLLGRQLKENQQVFIMAFTSGIVPDEAPPRKALADIHRLQAKAEANAQAQAISDQDIDAAMEEAMQHVRPPIA